MENFSPEKWAEKALQQIVALADKSVGIDPRKWSEEKMDRWNEESRIKWNLW
jgi:hypothetical protein